MLPEFKYCLKYGISLNFVLVLCFKCRISTLANIQIVQMFAEFVSKSGYLFRKILTFDGRENNVFHDGGGGFGSDNNNMDSRASITR